GIVFSETGQFLPRLAAVLRFKQRRVFHTGVNMLGIMKWRLQMANALELPRMLSAVIPLMCARDTVVNEFVALAFRHSVGTFQFLRAAPWGVPLFSAVIRALNDLAEPRAGLRCINSVRIDWRTFYMINFPARKMRTADFPSFAPAIRCQDESPFSCTNQNSNAT